LEVNDSAIEHIPVLAKQLAEQIILPPDAVMVDATLGQGGHSRLFGQSLCSEAVLIGIDVDQKNIEVARSRLAELDCKVEFVHSNFAQIIKELEKLRIEKVDFILADLGVCSSQLTDSNIGLSFQTNMPLDMRIDKRLKTTAADIVNNTEEKSLANLIYNYGQDRASRRIARFIAQYRRQQRIETSEQLSMIVCRALRQRPKKRKSKIHPATRTFQALRIAVNNELVNLERLLVSAPKVLNKNGYVAVISFHSLEDRLVKVSFKENEKNEIYKILTKKPITPSSEEIEENRRARSAKLRIAQRL